MSNCLVTRLKGVVNDPNLPYLGEISVNMKIKDITTPALRDLLLSSDTTEINWESDVDVYNAPNTNPNRVNLGRKGTIAIAAPPGSRQLYADGNVNFRIYPMYDLTHLFPHTRFTGQVNLDKLKVNRDTVKVEGFRGGGLYGHLDQIDYTLELTDTGYGVVLPMSLNGKYDKVKVPTTVTCGLAWYGDDMVYETTAGFADTFLLENVEDNIDICGLLNGENIASLLNGIVLPVDNKIRVSDITRFKFQNCPNLGSFIIHTPTEPIPAAGFVTAFKDNTKITHINISGNKGTIIEILPVLQGMKAAGRVSSTLTVWGAAFSLNGENLPGRNVVFTFDANGNWTHD